MRIKTRIKLSIIFSLVLAATIALLLFLGIRAVNEESRLEGIAVEVMKGVAELKIVTHEYILHPEERSLMQWRSKYGSLSKLLTGGHFKNPDEKIVADQIFMNLERFKTVFSDLAAGLRKGQALGKQESSAFRELQDRLTGELLVKSQLTVCLAFQLQQKIETESAKTQKRAALLTFFLLLTLSTAIVGISLWVNRSVAKPIAKLEKDTQIIGSGNLDHKVGTPAKDEIGELSRAFDKMTQDLKETTTSIVELNKEIDERKQAEGALRESEEKFRNLYENSPFGILICQMLRNEKREFADFIHIEENQSVHINTGFELNQLIGKKASEVVDSKVLTELVELYGSVISTGKPIHYEQHFDVYDRTLDITAFPLHGDLFIINFINISERKRAEEALRKSELQFKSTFEQAAVGICHADPSGTFLRTNLRFSEILGYTGKELGALTWHNITHPDDLNADLEKVQQVLENELKSYTIEKRFLRKDGVIVWVNVTVSLVRKLDGSPHYFIGVIEDLSERKNMEFQLQRAQKMEAMGLMAGGVAHDLNNILSGIVSYPELLLLDLPEDSPLRKPIKTIQESGMRAADVVEDLLTIARGVTTSKEVLNLNTVIEQYMDSAEQQKLEKIKPLSTYRTELDSELLNITCSASHVKKILMNLTVNASEAIEGTGTVTISTMNRYLDEPLKGYEDVRTGEYVLLSLSDDGSGISPQDLDKIFEPFYTKKVMGRSGTGLGLAVVWNSMQDHKGYINVRTSEKGTVFELYFPTTREQVAAGAEEVPLDDYLGHGERILVVDDEERQREIAGGILTRLGYNSETVSSGEEAIEYVKEHPVDLIVLDMVMPKGINGRRTYEEIIKIHPGQKAIIASGYSKTKEVDLAQELGAGKYIKKPYTLPKVGFAVKEELEK